VRENRIESRVSLKLFPEGWVKQLPSANGELFFNTTEDVVTLSVRLADWCEVTDVSVYQWKDMHESLHLLPADWDVFKRSYHLVAHFVTDIKRLHTRSDIDYALTRFIASLLSIKHVP
jgi:hypothetical protein